MRILSISLSISNLTNTFSTFWQFSFTLFVSFMYILGYTPKICVAAAGGKRSKIGMGGCNMVAFRPTFWLFWPQHSCIKAYFDTSCVDILGICVDFVSVVCRFPWHSCHESMTISDKNVRWLLVNFTLIRLSKYAVTQCPYEHNRLSKYAVIERWSTCMHAYAHTRTHERAQFLYWIFDKTSLEIALSLI